MARIAASSGARSQEKSRGPAGPAWPRVAALGFAVNSRATSESSVRKDRGKSDGGTESADRIPREVTGSWVDQSLELRLIVNKVDTSSGWNAANYYGRVAGCGAPLDVRLYAWAWQA